MGWALLTKYFVSMRKKMKQHPITPLSHLHCNNKTIIKRHVVLKIITTERERGGEREGDGCVYSIVLLLCKPMKKCNIISV